MKQHWMDKIADKLYIDGVHPLIILMVWEIALLGILVVIISLFVAEIPNALSHINFKY
ncbi:MULTISPECIES: hypothetical protein [Lactococcus]|uniref:Uncharacterized protein n=1 Tax=Lactococcus formosensis TaxID=1281486 RepID=A0A9Q8Y0E7_9LACT|nr:MULTISPECIES: hypothetical protein [Lactococcus]MBS4459741.1 hypothetical protein [Lactococcus petauri]MCH1722226.1 hypothetical protein [Lactococcus formosensis]MCO7180209.1 hypothetical protein [Lactococcus formosensis]MDG6111111.1 hypothetical protein [Lactococcus formosensis]MDG6113951.1 hypothetical protein [Lactococcus formosensis]